MSFTRVQDTDPHKLPEDLRTHSGPSKDFLTGTPFTCMGGGEDMRLAFVFHCLVPSEASLMSPGINCMGCGFPSQFTQFSQMAEVAKAAGKKGR